jgi:hypothetical protein
VLRHHQPTNFDDLEYNRRYTGDQVFSLTWSKILLSIEI